MQWFFDWWNSLEMIQQVFACMALPATIIMVIQSIMLLFGMGFGHDGDAPGMDHDTGGHEFDAHDHCGMDHDADGHEFDAHDHDYDGDTHSNIDIGLRIFTVRGIVAFFAIGGWVGIAFIDMNLSPTFATLSAVVGGLLTLLLVAYFLKWSMRLQDSGNMNPNNAIAKTGTVYINIPPERSGTGKVNVVVQNAYTEFDAVTDSDRPIKSGAQIQVTGVIGETTLVVRPVSEKAKEPAGT